MPNPGFSRRVPLQTELQTAKPAARGMQAAGCCISCGERSRNPLYKRSGVRAAGLRQRGNLYDKQKNRPPVGCRQPVVVFPVGREVGIPCRCVLVYRKASVPAKASFLRHVPGSAPGRAACAYLMVAVVSFWITSWAPPSTMEVADTRVSLAFCWNSGMFSAPQLHMVERTLLRVRATLSFRRPA